MCALKNIFGCVSMKCKYSILTSLGSPLLAAWWTFNILLFVCIYRPTLIFKNMDILFPIFCNSPFHLPAYFVDFFFVFLTLTSILCTCDMSSTRRSVSLRTVATFQHLAVSSLFHGSSSERHLGVFTLLCHHSASWKSLVLSVPCWDSLWDFWK